MGAGDQTTSPGRPTRYASSFLGSSSSFLGAASFLGAPLFGSLKSAPGYLHFFAPSSSSIRRSWLYFARRSERHGAPVLICLKKSVPFALLVLSIV